MPEFRYANNIHWGETYNKVDGMHHIHARDEQEAWEKANRSDKKPGDYSFLQRSSGGDWYWCD